MTARSIQALTVVVLVSLAACSRDLTLPDPPGVGQVSGQIDTQGKIPADGNDVALVAEDGSRTFQPTSGGGMFVFGNVQPGLYYLEVSLPGFATLLRPSIRVRGGDVVALGTLTPTWLQGTSLEAQVQGKVIAQGNGDPTGGQVQFLLQPVGTPVAQATLGADGTFVERVPPGSYTLRATHPLYQTTEVTGLTFAEGEQRDLTSEPMVLDVNPARLTGSVLRERDGQDPVPASGALVTLGTGDTTTTDVDGNFLLTGLRGGSHTVRVTLAGYHDPEPSRTVELQPGGTSPLAPVTVLLDRGAVAGTVELSDLQPARDVTVALTGVPYSALLSPDPSDPSRGTFQISGVPVGQYELTATKASYARAALPLVTVTVAATTNVGVLTLAPLQGDFVIEDANPSNTAGYTRTTDVTLDLTSFGSPAEYRASEDGTFAGVSFVPFGAGSSKPFTLSLAQGTHIVYAQYKDALGNTSPTFSASIVLDSEPPAPVQLTLSDGRDFVNVANPLVVRLDAQDVLGAGVDAISGVAHMRLSTSNAVDGNGVLLATRVSFLRDTTFVRPTSDEGPETVYAQVEDHAGNVSAVVSDQVVIDTLPPSGGISILRGTAATLDGYTNSPLVQVQPAAAAEPNGGFVRIKLANRTEDLASAVLQTIPASAVAWFIDPTTQGTKPVYAILEDAAGNSSGNLSASIVFDTVPPNPAAASLIGPSPTNVRGITLSLDAADSNGLSPTEAVTASEDPFFRAAGTVGPQPYPASTQLDFTLGGSDGPKVVYVRYRDAAGNDAVANALVELDTAPPAGSLAVEGTLADGTPSRTVTSTASVKALITQSGATEYLLGDETLTTCPTTGYAPLVTSEVNHTLTGAANPRRVSLCLRDAASNRAGPFTADIALDASTPAGCALTLQGLNVDGSAAPPGKTGRMTVDASFGSSCSETPAEMYLTTGSVSCNPSAPLSWQPFQSPVSFPLPGPDGLATVSGCVRDRAHNTGPVVAASITLDTTPPAAPSLLIDDGAAYINDADVTARGGNFGTATGAALGAVYWALSEDRATLTDFQPLAGPRQYLFGGTGPRTLFAAFRDDVGNVSAVASDGIEIDVTPPTGGGVTIRTPNGSAYSNSVAVTLEVTAPADAAKVLMGQAASPAACVDSDLAAAIPMGLAPAYTFVLSSGDGQKRVCLRFLDAAGNPSSIVEAPVTLDTVPPTQPVVLTTSRIFNPGGTLAFNVTTSGAVTETNFASYQILGGATESWTDVAGPATRTTFGFTLRVDGSAAAGLDNVLRVRAKDLAGNFGPEGSVVITTDIVGPTGVQLNARWVTNSFGQSTLFWQPSDPGLSPDVAGYNIYYAASSQAPAYDPATYLGQYASQGASPVRIGNVTQATLSGLPNGALTYVTIRAVDRAGNVGDQPPFGAYEIQLMPNIVSPDLVVDVPLSMSEVKRLAVSDHYAYAFGASSSCDAVLQPIDLRTLVSAVQGGSIQTSPPLPTVGTAQSFADGMDYTSCNNGTDMVVSGMHLFTASGTRVRIFSLAVPFSPALVATLDLSAQVTAVHALEVRGSTLFAGGRTASGMALIAIDIGKLYDASAATVPSTADLIGTAPFGSPSFAPMGLTLTRDRLVAVASPGGGGFYFNVADAVDGNVATAFDAADYLGTSSVFLGTNFTRNIASGNYLYNFNNFFSHMLDLRLLWSLTPPFMQEVATFGIGAGGQNDVEGGQAFLNQPVASAIRSMDLSDMGALVDTGLFPLSGLGSPESNIVYGNYLLVGTSSGRFVVLELATPRSMHTTTSLNAGGIRADLSGGILYGGSGSAVDLHSGYPPAALNTGSGICHYDVARIGDVMVSSMGNAVRLFNMEDAVDRDTGTLWSSADYLDLAAPAGVKVTGLDVVGPYLVAAEIRTSGTTGTFLEVFDARKLLRRATWNTFTFADSVGSFRVSTYNSASAWADLSMTAGRALVSLDDSSVPNPGLFVVDLRSLLDDDSATVPGASSIQASLAVSQPRKGIIRGAYAYVPTTAGLSIIDVSQAMDEDPGTLVPASPPSASVPMSNGGDSLAVYGSYAIVTPMANTASGVTAVDISSPLQPRVIGFLPRARGSMYCGYYPRGSTLIRGSRAYLTGYEGLDIVELE